MSYAITVVASLVVTAATCYFVGFDFPVALLGLSVLSLPLGLLALFGGNVGKIALVAAVTATTLIGVVWAHDVYVHYKTLGSVAWNKVTSATWSDAYQLLPPIVQVNPFAGYAAGSNTTWLAEVDELAHRRLRGTAQYLKCGVPPQPGELQLNDATGSRYQAADHVVGGPNAVPFDCGCNVTVTLAPFDMSNPRCVFNDSREIHFSVDEAVTEPVIELVNISFPENVTEELNITETINVTEEINITEAMNITEEINVTDDSSSSDTADSKPPDKAKAESSETAPPVSATSPTTATANKTINVTKSVNMTRAVNVTRAVNTTRTVNVTRTVNMTRTINMTRTVTKIVRRPRVAHVLPTCAFSDECLPANITTNDPDCCCYSFSQFVRDAYNHTGPHGPKESPTFVWRTFFKVMQYFKMSPKTFTMGMKAALVVDFFAGICEYIGWWCFTFFLLYWTIPFLVRYYYFTSMVTWYAFINDTEKSHGYASALSRLTVDGVPMQVRIPMALSIIFCSILRYVLTVAFNFFGYFRPSSLKGALAQHVLWLNPDGTTAEFTLKLLSERVAALMPASGFRQVFDPTSSDVQAALDKQLNAFSGSLSANGKNVGAARVFNMPHSFLATLASGGSGWFGYVNPLLKRLMYKGTPYYAFSLSDANQKKDLGSAWIAIEATADFSGMSSTSSTLTYRLCTPPTSAIVPVTMSSVSKTMTLDELFLLRCGLNDSAHSYDWIPQSTSTSTASPARNNNNGGGRQNQNQNQNNNNRKRGGNDNNSGNGGKGGPNNGNNGNNSRGGGNNRNAQASANKANDANAPNSNDTSGSNRTSSPDKRSNSPRRGRGRGTGSQQHQPELTEDSAHPLFIDKHQIVTPNNGCWIAAPLVLLHRAAQLLEPVTKTLPENHIMRKLLRPRWAALHGAFEIVSIAKLDKYIGKPGPAKHLLTSFLNHVHIPSTNRRNKKSVCLNKVLCLQEDTDPFDVPIGVLTQYDESPTLPRAHSSYALAYKKQPTDDQYETDPYFFKDGDKEFKLSDANAAFYLCRSSLLTAGPDDGSWLIDFDIPVDAKCGGCNKCYSEHKCKKRSAIVCIDCNKPFFGYCGAGMNPELFSVECPFQCRTCAKKRPLLGERTIIATIEQPSDSFLHGPIVGPTPVSIGGVRDIITADIDDPFDNTSPAAAAPASSGSRPLSGAAAPFVPAAARTATASASVPAAAPSTRQPTSIIIPGSGSELALAYGGLPAGAASTPPVSAAAVAAAAADPQRRHRPAPSVTELRGDALVPYLDKLKDCLDNTITKYYKGVPLGILPPRSANLESHPDLHHAWSIISQSLANRKLQLRNLIKLTEDATERREEAKQASFPDFVVNHLQLRARTGKNREGGIGWKPATLHRTAASLIGACMAVHLFLRNETLDLPLRLMESTTFYTAMTTMKKAAMTTAPVDQETATAEDIVQAMGHATHPTTRFSIMLLFKTGMRIGEINQLRRGNIHLDLETGFLRVHVGAGKGVEVRKGKWEINSRIMERTLAQEFYHYLTNITDKQAYVFPPPQGRALSARTSIINKTLGKVRQGLTTRAIRRGSLQAMALGETTGEPVPEEVLMCYSGHKSKATLNRYLGWGNANEHQHQQTRAAAANLALDMDQEGEVEEETSTD